jgi:hypothetical protein
LYSAGIKRRRARSPEPPKITSVQGSTGAKASCVVVISIPWIGGMALSYCLTPWPPAALRQPVFSGPMNSMFIDSPSAVVR